MTWIVDRDTLVSALETCAPIANKRQINPSLAQVRLVLGKSLQFSATDTVLSVVGSRDVVETGNEVAFAANCSDFLEAARRMPAGGVRLSLDAGGTLTGKGGARSFRLVTLGADTMPEPIERPKSKMLRIAGSALAGVVGRVRHAMSSEDRVFDGIKLSLREGLLEAQAYDDRRGAAATIKVDTDGALDILVSPGLVGPLLSAAERYAADIGITESDGALYLDTEAGLFRYLSSVQRNFPVQFREALLTGGDATAAGDSKALLDALKYIDMASDRGVPEVFIESADGDFLLKSSNGKLEATDRIQLDTSGKFNTKINPRFLAEAIAQAGEKCTLTHNERTVRVSGENYEAAVAKLRA